MTSQRENMHDISKPHSEKQPTQTLRMLSIIYTDRL